ncbi:RNA-binding protein [Cellulomonas composti]|uniref:RNA-binding protein n=2 Tax=Cellulomonas composti TaxID=266130 RepID=A0A511J749_9CELL|nr:RNA-binding protein [Cellulomonas composti]
MPVPAQLRAALVAVAADTLSGLDAVAVPPTLRRVHRFAPRVRASAGAQPLWAALGDDAFRARVARTWIEVHPDLASVVGPTPDETAPDGTAPDETAPDETAPDETGEGVRSVRSLEAAAGAWLLGGDWTRFLPEPAEPQADVTAALRDAERASHEVERLRSELAEARALASSAQEALATAQREMRRLRSDADRARAEGRTAAAQAAVAAQEAAEDLARAVAEREQASTDRRVAQAERSDARAQARVAQQLADVRVRLLLDSIVDAASGLRAELALPPAAELPADLVAPERERAPVRAGSRGRQVDDPALLEELLRLPRAHLVVDGYNVSKTWFDALTLEQQRRRLVQGLEGLAARTGAEVTCCFDGREDAGAPTAAPVRGVRVRFSVGEIADDLIRRLVAAEPPGRVVVVVTSDQEVVRDVEARGAYVVPSATLVARLQHA